MGVQVLANEKNIKDFFSLLFNKRLITIFLLGFSTNIAYIIAFNNISEIIDSANLELYYGSTHITWPLAIYGCRFLWGPLIDRIPIPVLNPILGRRRSWLAVSQISSFIAIAIISIIDPEYYFSVFAFFILLLSIFISIQLMLVDAIRIESANKNLQALMIAVFLCSYQIGDYVCNSLFNLAEYFLYSDGNYNFKIWSIYFICISLIMLLSIFVTFYIKEPENDENLSLLKYSKNEYFRTTASYLLCIVAFFIVFNLSYNYALANIKDILSAAGISIYLIANFKIAICFVLSLLSVIVILNLSNTFKLIPMKLCDSMVIRPITEFFNRFQKNIFSLLLLIVSYRIPELLSKSTYKIFCLDAGYANNSIYYLDNNVLPVANILGAVFAGLLSLRLGIIRTLLHGSVFSFLGTLLMLIIINNKVDIEFMYLLATVEHFFYGFSYVIFVGLISIIVARGYSATQFVILYMISSMPANFIDHYIQTIIQTYNYTEIFFLCVMFSSSIIWLSYNVRNVLFKQFNISVSK